MELFKILGTIAIDNEGANGAIDETVGIAERAHSKISTAFEKVGSAAVKVGKVMATGLAAGTAATGALVKSAVEAYADYEQLVGGVETLFKDSADIVKGYADEAYKSAGLSANEYMETVTSFSASLLQGLDGDTAAAAEIANRAITDMSDNANKMGTDMSLIQNAYQGFAKQNYTMLDNLKLGYGGTASEMARLINESGVLGDTMVVTAETVNEVSFDQIIKAIGVVQTRMGITGTTAKEASSTISGSIASMKSAWKNLLTGVADDEADFVGLVDNFVEAVGVAGENVIDRVEVALVGAAKLVEKLFPVIMDKIPAIITDVLPKLLQSAASIVQSLVDGISQNQELIMSAIFDVCMIIGQVIAETLPEIFGLGVALLVTFAEGIVDNLDTLVPLALEMIWKIVETLMNPDTLETLFTAAVEIILALANGLIKYLPQLATAAIETIKKLVTLLTDEETLDRLLDAALEIILALADAIVEVLPELLDAAVEILVKLAEYLTDPENLLKIVETGIKLVGAIAKGLLDCVGTLAEGAGELVSTIIDTIFETDWLQVGKDIVTAIAEGLLDGLENLVGFFKEHEGLTSGMFDFGSSMGGITPSLPTTNSGGSWTDIYNLPSHAEGLDYVPYDGYVAELHKGEMVVPAAESEFLRSGSTGAAIVEILQLQLDLLSSYFPQLIENAGHDIVTNDGAILARYAPLMNAELGRISNRKDRGR